MVRSSSATRRRVLRAMGATTIAALLAGCNDGGGPEDGGNGGDGNGADGNGGDGNGADGNGGDGNGGDGGIEPGTRIVFEAQTQAWLGQEPESIADAENPTLTLTAGETYEIGWEEGDGSTHNIEIRDENDEVVDDLETEEVTEPQEEGSQFLEFEASEEMTAYICDPHEGTMNGELDIGGGNGGGNGGAGNESTDGNGNGAGNGGTGGNGNGAGNGGTDGNGNGAGNGGTGGNGGAGNEST